MGKKRSRNPDKYKPKSYLSTLFGELMESSRRVPPGYLPLTIASSPDNDPPPSDNPTTTPDPNLSRFVDAEGLEALRNSLRLDLTMLTLDPTTRIQWGTSVMGLVKSKRIYKMEKKLAIRRGEKHFIPQWPYRRRRFDVIATASHVREFLDLLDEELPQGIPPD